MQVTCNHQNSVRFRMGEPNRYVMKKIYNRLKKKFKYRNEIFPGVRINSDTTFSVYDWNRYFSTPAAQAQLDRIKKLRNKTRV